MGASETIDDAAGIVRADAWGTFARADGTAVNDLPKDLVNDGLDNDWADLCCMFEDLFLFDFLIDVVADGIVVEVRDL